MRNLIYILMILLTSSLGAQDEDEGQLDAEQWESSGGYPAIEGEEVNSTLRVEELQAPRVDYHFSPFAKKSPFVAPLMAKPQGIVIKKKNFTVLNRFQLKDLRFVGIWKTKGGTSKVLVMTPKGEGIVAQVGSGIGTSNGKIVRILNRGLIVREYTVRLDGTREYEDIRLNLDDRDPEKIDENDEIGPRKSMKEVLSH